MPAGEGWKDRKGDPERSDEERVALWEGSGRLSGLGELPGGGGLRGRASPRLHPYLCLSLQTAVF